jgi:ribosome biogenesis ATPase
VNTLVVIFLYAVLFCCFRALVKLKKCTDKSADAAENEKAIVVDIVEEPSESAEKSAAGKPSSRKAPSEESSKKEGSSKGPQQPITENVLNNKPSSCKNNELLELIAWLHDGQRPLSDQQLNELHVELDDFRQALKCVQPSAKREGFATVPDVTWDDVGSLRDVREELQMTILVSEAQVMFSI